MSQARESSHCVVACFEIVLVWERFVVVLRQGLILYARLNLNLQGFYYRETIDMRHQT